MSESNARVCQWLDCTNESIKHVMYNHRAKGVVESNNNHVTIGLSINHADLCDAHVSELRKQVGGVFEKEHGYCSDDCPSQW